MIDQIIKTFVVFDLETNNFPSYQFNKCSITELSLYAFSADSIHNDKHIPKDNILDQLKGFVQDPPELPRSLHKMTLMINPQRAIHPDAERITGLSNEMLEHESPFDKNTAECLNLFLNRLEGPICLVAHNGMFFDFPILRYVYDRIEMTLPSSIYCVDSYKAFREIDEKRENIKKEQEANVMTSSSSIELDILNQKQVDNIQDNVDNDLQSSYDTKLENVKEIVCNIDKEINEMSSLTDTIDPLVKNSLIDWQHINDTTPQKKTKAEKRSYCLSSDSNLITPESSAAQDKRSTNLKARRSLYSENYTPKTKYNKKGEYQLGNIFIRCFGREPLNLHRAETDVDILTRLILHYGIDFLAYAEERKKLFSTVPKLGTRIH